ncbi:hypothetical protein PCIT_a2394 [Pseudoalteromonas citrea]|uniref:AB hydrolase-1 domain-containing protein n=2 Tax=Pseudoalteromonas citrea TaxID=43655 RepID=A0AAD4AJP3_9GAMM|nr:alpha/beta fold hydrolase [Pseudoalteromonas citrea]KAF7772338.1 hypothetical protein PCIT_a2394 [Pseudoalteromonas citrea]
MSIKTIFSTKGFKIMAGLFFFLGAIYYAFFTLDTENLTTEQIVDSYNYTPVEHMNFELNELDDRLFEFSYTTFDGSKVKGQINYPQEVKDKYPVLIGLHAMGRSYPRWWTDSINGRPTVTQVNKITQQALQKGYVVIAIDARYHGSRKVADKSLRSIMFDVNFLGDKTDYVEMMSHTILDHRVLLDWIEQQKQLDISNVHVAGYSMGGQSSLLLAGVDKRVSNVLAIVPPHIENTTASVAPKNVASLLKDQKIWLVTTDNDEYASESNNLALYNALASSNKKHIIFKGGHIIHREYVESLADWF